MMRRSECMTAVMVLPAASARDVKAVDSANAARMRLSAIAGSFLREIWDIPLSPDMKLVKARSSVEHEVRYLGELTRCKSLSFETCIKRIARQSRFGCCVASAQSALYK